MKPVVGATYNILLNLEHCAAVVLYKDVAFCRILDFPDVRTSTESINSTFLSRSLNTCSESSNPSEKRLNLFLFSHLDK